MTKGQAKIMLSLLARLQIVAERQGKGPLFQASRAAQRQLIEDFGIDALETFDYTAESWANAIYELAAQWGCDPVTGHLGEALA